VEFLVASGGRFGEVAALRPGDVDRDAGTVRITRAAKRTYDAEGYELGPTKTRKARTINVATSVLDKLDYTHEWLFVNRVGRPPRPAWKGPRALGIGTCTICATSTTPTAPTSKTARWRSVTPARR
jgi:integrase